MDNFLLKNKFVNGVKELSKYVGKLRYLVIFFAFIYFFYLILFKSNEIISLHLELNPKNLLFSFLILGINQLLFSLAWHYIILSVYGSYNIFVNLLAYSETQIAKILPTPVFFIVSRISFYKTVQNPIKAKHIAISIFLENYFTMFSGLLLIGCLSVILSTFVALLFWYLITITTSIIFLYVFSRVLRKHITLSKNSMKNLIIACLIIMLTWLLSFPFSQYLVQGLFDLSGEPVFWLSLWKIWILSSLLSYLGTLIGGLGFLREFSMAILLSTKFSIIFSTAIAVVSRLLLIIANIFWSVVIIFLAKKIRGN